MTHRVRTIRFLIRAISLILLSSAGTPAASKTAVAVASTAFFERPEPGLLPRGYIDRRDSCTVDSVIADSAGTAWFHIRAAKSEGWAVAGGLRYVSDVPADFFSKETRGDEDKKRRADIVKNHPEWPLRIRKAVHAGQVCIDMTADQLVASWGEPVEKRKMYMLGIGDYSCLIYNGTSRATLLVSLQGGRVVGWSVEQDK